MKSVSSIKASSSALIFQIAGLILSKMTVESCTFDCGFGTKEKKQSGISE